MAAIIRDCIEHKLPYAVYSSSSRGRSTEPAPSSQTNILCSNTPSTASSTSGAKQSLLDTRPCTDFSVFYRQKHSTLPKHLFSMNARRTRATTRKQPARVVGDIVTLRSRNPREEAISHHFAVLLQLLMGERSAVVPCNTATWSTSPKLDKHCKDSKKPLCKDSSL